MSRTDVHAPGWVKERDPLWRANHVEDHNHHQYVIGHEKTLSREGRVYWKPIYKKVERCDLDEYVASRGWFIRTACQISYHHTGRNISCGCSLCTGQIGRRVANRSDRQRTRRLLRAGRWDDICGWRRGRY